MKTISFLCAALFVQCLPARSQLSQLTLNEGDTFVYEFSTIPFQANIDNSGFPPTAYLVFLPSSSSFQPGDTLRYEMFENNLQEAPMATGTMTSLAPPFPLTVHTLSAAGGWSDLQGVIRFTQLSGSLTINTISLTVTLPHDQLTLDRYIGVVPIPEPSIGALALLGCGICLIGKRYYRRNTISFRKVDRAA